MKKLLDFYEKVAPKLLQILQTICVQARCLLKANPRFEAIVDSHIIIPANRLGKDSYRFLNRCTKPDRREYRKTVIATLTGFAIMGVIGFAVKLVHIPIINIIVGPK